MNKLFFNNKAIATGVILSLIVAVVLFQVFDPSHLFLEKWTNSSNQRIVVYSSVKLGQAPSQLLKLKLITDELQERGFSEARGRTPGIEEWLGERYCVVGAALNRTDSSGRVVENHTIVQGVVGGYGVFEREITDVGPRYGMETVDAIEKCIRSI